MANATYQPQSTAALYASEDGNRVVYLDSGIVAANLATTDKLRLCKIAAGTKVDRVVIKNPDLDSGTTLAVNIGFSHVDGSTLAQSTAVASAATTWQAAATTTYEIFPPITLEKDSYLEVVPTAAGVGTGTVYGKVEGEMLGAK